MAVTSETKEQIEGEIEVLCHRVTWRYWDFEELVLDEEIRELLENEAEERAKYCITEGFHSGDLNCYYCDEVRGRVLKRGGRWRNPHDWRGPEYEIRGWWEIKK